MLNEADTCRKFVVPKLLAAGRDEDPHSIAEQRSITEGRIVPAGKSFVRKAPKRVDYLLRYERNFPLAVVEAKVEWKTAGEGMQQAKEYAEMLGLHFAYSTNGHEILEFDRFTGHELTIGEYPTPNALWTRYRAGQGLASDEVASRLLTPRNHAAARASATTRKSRSIELSRESWPAGGANCSPWRPARDGFLAPYRVHRVITEWDAAGWRPSKDELDRYGREIPDEEYGTKDFERVVALRLVRQRSRVI